MQKEFKTVFNIFSKVNCSNMIYISKIELITIIYQFKSLTKKMYGNKTI